MSLDSMMNLQEDESVELKEDFSKQTKLVLGNNQQIGYDNAYHPDSGKKHDFFESHDNALTQSDFFSLDRERSIEEFAMSPNLKQFHMLNNQDFNRNNNNFKDKDDTKNDRELEDALK